MSDPTDEAYSELRFAFDFFNSKLFQNQLKTPLITLPRERMTYGYHSKNRFRSRDTKEMADEIALNPAYFAYRSLKKTLSTLVHEMAHMWQDAHGKPGRGRYHNKEWAFKMMSIGLQPSDTGKPGGKMTGDQMTHYIIKGGLYDLHCDELMKLEFRGKEFKLSWFDIYPAGQPEPEHLYPAPAQSVDGEDGFAEEGSAAVDYVAELTEDIIQAQGLVERPEPKALGKSNRSTFQCPTCGQLAWGKPSLVVLCGVGGCRQALMLRLAPGATPKRVRDLKDAAA